MSRLRDLVDGTRYLRTGPVLLRGAFLAVVAGGPRLGDLRVGAVVGWGSATAAWVSGGIAAAVVAVLLAVTFPALSHCAEQPER